MNLADLRRKIPELEGLDDASAVDAIQQAYYPDIDRQQIADRLGVKFATPAAAPKSAGLMRTAGDIALKGAQGVVGLGESVVGLADLATGGYAGKGLAAVGYDPKATNEFIGQGLSDAQQQADQRVADAQGIVDTVTTALQNPRSIMGSVAESAPGILGIGGVSSLMARTIFAKAAMAAGGAGTAAGQAAGKAAVEAASGRLMWAGAGAEGAQTAGSIAEQARQNDPNDPSKMYYGVPAGIGTALIGRAAGKMMGDAETAIFTGAKSAGLKGSLPARIGKGVFSEGALEEMPQSAQEQVFTNLATDKPAGEGVGNAAGMGLVTGGAMGGGMAILQGRASEAQAELATRRLATADNVTDMIGAAEDLALAPLTPETPRAAGAAAIAEIRQLDPEQQAEAMGLLGTSNNMQAPGHVRRFAQNRLDELLKPVRQVPVGDAAEMLPVGEATELAPAGENERRAADTLKRWMANAEPVDEARANEMVAKAAELGKGDFAVVPHTSGGFTVVPKTWLTPGMADRLMAKQRATQWPDGRIPVGEAADMIPVGDATEAPAKIPTGKATEIDVEQIQADDLLTADGMPYGTRAGAAVRATREGSGEVVQVPGGFVVRKENPDVNQYDVAATSGVPATAGAGRGSDAGGGVGNVRPVAGTEAGQQSAAPGAPAASGGPAAPVGNGNQQRDDALSNDIPTLKKQWADAVRANDNVLAKRINEKIVSLKAAPKAEQNNPPPRVEPSSSGQEGGIADKPGSDQPEAAQNTAPTAPLKERVDAKRTPSQAARDAMIQNTANPAYESGKAAALSGKPREPYPELSAERTSDWLRGWDDAKPDAAAPAEKAPPKVRVPVAAAPRQGRIGDKMAGGEVVLTASGRETSPFPRVDVTTTGKTNRTVERVNNWLMANALREAELRGDDFNARQFRAANWLNPTQADKDSAEEYLFGEQPAVVPSILRPLSAKAAAPNDPIGRLEKMTPQEREDWGHWWGVGGNAGVADALTIAGRESALQSIGEPIVLAARRWNTLPIQVRGKLLAVRDGTNDELDAEMRSYENKAAAPVPATKAEPSPPVEAAQGATNGDQGQGQGRRQGQGRLLTQEAGATQEAPAAPEAEPKSTVGPYAKWRDSTPSQRRDLLREAGYTDADQARTLSGTDWNQLTDPVRRALSAAPVSPAQATSPASETSPATETAPPKPKRPPKSFRKKVKVTTPVFVEETSSFEPREIDAETALQALDEDVSELEKFIACLKG